VRAVSQKKTRPAEAAAATDAFSFGSADLQAQSVRNFMVMATLPMTAFWAMGAEAALHAWKPWSE